MGKGGRETRGTEDGEALNIRSMFIPVQAPSEAFASGVTGTALTSGALGTARAAPAAGRHGFWTRQVAFVIFVRPKKFPDPPWMSRVLIDFRRRSLVQTAARNERPSACG